MGDPTEQSKGEDSGQLHQSADSNDDTPLDSDNEDVEAEQVQAAAEQNYNSTPQHALGRRPTRSLPQPSANLDTVHSILSSISNPNAAVVIPVDASPEGEEEIDAERLEHFYTGALSAITKMRKQTVKAETKIDKLREEVGGATMQAWTEEHFDSLKSFANTK